MKPRTSRLTHKQVLAALIYDEQSGLFTWRASRGGSTAKAGQPAGGINRSTGYMLLMVHRERHVAHRLAWFYVYGEWPRHQIDHINGDKLDNRICNLRDVPAGVNQQNQRQARSNSTTGFLGVSAGPYGRWNARIRHEGRLKHIGVFATPEAAHQAYLEAKRRLHEGCVI